MSKFLVLIALVAMTIIALPAIVMAEGEEESEILTTFSYGLSSGNLGTTHVAGFGFQFPEKAWVHQGYHSWLKATGNVIKVEFEYLDYIDSRGSIGVEGTHTFYTGSKSAYNDRRAGTYVANLVPQRQGIITVGSGRKFGSGKYGYCSFELMFGSAKGTYIRNFEVDMEVIVGYDKWGHPIYDTVWVPKQETKTGSAMYAGVGLGPEIELYPNKHFGFQLGARVGYYGISPFGENILGKLYWRGFTMLKVRL